MISLFLSFKRNRRLSLPRAFVSVKVAGLRVRLP